MHWTVSEPLTEACDACDAVAREADVDVELARELLDMGAVYVDTWPEGMKPGGKVKWRRAQFLDRPLQKGERSHPAWGEGGGRGCPLNLHF